MSVTAAGGIRRDLPPELAAQVDARLQAWQDGGFAARLWAKDVGLWPVQPPVEIADRMGWLGLPEAASAMAEGLEAFAEEVRAEGFHHVALLGMGGSSLAPDLFARVFGPAAGRPDLTVLDSTHPQQVAEVLRELPLRETLFVVSSKSGGTAETLSLMRYFWQEVRTTRPDPGRQFVAITDPGTSLETLSADREFRRLFTAPADVGGRYSALSVFGLVPAALLGVDLDELLASATAMARRCGPHVPARDHPALVLGAALGEAGRLGRDKITLRAERSVAGFSSWAEQLIAESTGKSGRGLLPVVDDPRLGPSAYGADRLLVDLGLRGRWSGGAEPPVPRARLSIGLEESTELGGEFFRWEFAVAAAGAVLGIHPFNQPDVQRAKDLARQALAPGAGGLAAPPVLPLAPSPAFAAWAAHVHPPEYVAIQAFLAWSAGNDLALARLSRALAESAGVSVTVGYGPRYLHSTGQFHKGGPATGRFLQLLDSAHPDIPVPETDFTFGRLLRAEADGDAAALAGAGRPVLRVDVGVDAPGAIGRLTDLLVAARPGNG